ncbi:MAG: MG2 domain-containing protein [Desulfobulbaceae bacterium]|nr:MG2 domain-containing protein [Desulfobulbaceae bacterium]
MDKDSNPVYYRTPKSFEAATNDGERWRWCLKTALELNPKLHRSVDWILAEFSRLQFGVQTMASRGRWGFQPQKEDDDDKSGTYAVHTLTDQETIAKTAVGIKRFKLSDEYNYITLYRKLADKVGSYQIEALRALAKIYENRRLYEQAADHWQQIIDLPNQSDHTYKQANNKLAQITGDWGRFEPISTQARGKGATVEFRFRNAKEVHFEAHVIKVAQLLDDTKSYIKLRPTRLDYQKVNLRNIGWRLVENNEQKYIGKKAAEWTLALSPRKNHWDRRVTVQTPLSQAGAYLLVAKLPGGHTSRIIIWLNDTVIVHKPLDQANMYYVADALTGKPLSGINLEFFGYRQEHLKWKFYKTQTNHFAEYTDKNGMVIPDAKDQDQNLQWLITATDKEGRFAYLGFDSVWLSNRYDHEYNQTKVFTISDRPVYRPGQTLKFKQWLRQAKYDLEDKSLLANRSTSIEILNPKGDRIFQKSYTTDEFGGLHDEFTIPADGVLGLYQIVNKAYGHSQSFRVEEYKKPEFEVTVEAPKEPVVLGETITAEIKAQYYFGEPVKEGKVKYKILRYEHSSRWFPHGTWDWLYEPGYWWFAYDYVWYPGWDDWGCFGPWPWWIHRASLPPEVVSEREIEIPDNGIIKVDIDTSLAKEIHGDKDHRYEITAEVTDLSRRTIVGQGRVLVARKPFKVYSWVDRGHYRTGDTIRASFSAQTLDNKPVKGKGKLVLQAISYDQEMQPIETKVNEWDLDTDSQGQAIQQMVAAKPGQYRLSYTVIDEKDHEIEGAYIFTVMGEKAEADDFRFNEIELVTDKREYRPGEKVKLRINTRQPGSVVLLFTRPSNGIYSAPKVIRLTGKSAEEQISISKKDMPNFFIEALVISEGKLHSITREVIVPPEKRILSVEVEPSAEEFKPGEQARIKLKLRDADGQPFRGSAVVTVYDKALEYISGGSNVSDIKTFFWKWRRSHNERTVSNLSRRFQNRLKRGERPMADLGVFGHMVADLQLGKGMVSDGVEKFSDSKSFAVRQKSSFRSGGPPMPAARMESNIASSALGEMEADFVDEIGTDKVGEEQLVQPAIRTKLADSAFWVADVTTDDDGLAEINMTMPDNLTGWMVKTWAMGHGTKVGEAETVIFTKKNLMVRLQAPRFFVEKDEVVLSANVHNYLKNPKAVQVVLEFEGDCLELMPEVQAEIPTEIAAGDEKRLDWRVKVVREGTATIRIKVLTDEESDAMETTFPVYVHGADKMVAHSGYLSPTVSSQSFTITVPSERRMDTSRLEIRYSPSPAGAMVDALPYLVDYPYGCTEQTLSRFLPTVITRKVLLSMGLDLKEIEQKRTNLNAQEIGDDLERAKQWRKVDKTYDEAGNLIEKNPVFNNKEVERMVKVGVRALTDMQLSDGGWGWFSGYGERSFPHTTAYVVHGLQIARDNDVALVPGVLKGGIKWLRNYEKEQLRELKKWDDTKKKGKSRADNLDAFVYMVLSDAGVSNKDMGQYLYRDRNHLSVYAKSMIGIGYHVTKQYDKRDMVLQNIEQHLVKDDENQTAYLNLENPGYWWYWYGSEYEAQAYYLKLLAKTGRVTDWKAPYLVKYLINNRKHANYWNSTRDTAIVIEALADYLQATDELQPDLQLEILVDGKIRQEVAINRANLFVYDNKFLLTGDELTSGEHTITLRKKGKGPLYFNAYLSYFSLEDFITRAGLEVKVQRRLFRLKPVDKTIATAGARGQVVDQKVEKFERELLANDAMLQSGDLVEVELVIESKNDYEYLVFEDFKPAGFEAVKVRSGYTGNEMGAYVEFRDNRTAFFVPRLARGKHSVSYRLRAEIPGRFSALPAQGYAMYAPELRGNSDEIKVNIKD